jgi:hypothetical protein
MRSDTYGLPAAATKTSLARPCGAWGGVGRKRRPTELLGAAGRARGGGRWTTALLSPSPPSYLKQAGRRQPRCRVRSPFASAADRGDGLRLRFRFHRKSGGRPPPAASHRCIPMWAEGALVWGKGRSGAGEGRERRRALRWMGKGGRRCGLGRVDERRS